MRERLAGVIGRASTERTVALRYPNPGGTGASGTGVGHALGLTWPDVPEGDYRFDVTLVPGTPGRQSVTSALVVHIVEE